MENLIDDPSSLLRSTTELPLLKQKKNLSVLFPNLPSFHSKLNNVWSRGTELKIHGFPEKEIYQNDDPIEVAFNNDDGVNTFSENALAFDVLGNCMKIILFSFFWFLLSSTLFMFFIAFSFSSFYFSFLLFFTFFFLLASFSKHLFCKKKEKIEKKKKKKRRI